MLTSEYTYMGQYLYLAKLLVNFVIVAAIAVCLFTRRQPGFLLIAYCICVIISLLYDLYCIVGYIPLMRYMPELQYIFTDNALYAVGYAVRSAFIILSLNVARYPAEVSLRHLMCDRNAGMLDEAAYQEQRAEVISSL